MGSFKSHQMDDYLSRYEGIEVEFLDNEIYDRIEIRIRSLHCNLQLSRNFDNYHIRHENSTRDCIQIVEHMINDFMRELVRLPPHKHEGRANVNLDNVEDDWALIRHKINPEPIKNETLGVF